MLELVQATESQLNFIYGELNTTPEAIRRDVCSLMEWLKKQPHLPNVEDEQMLTHCLLRCKNSVEKCKTVLEAYYTLKSAMPEIYDDRDPYALDIERCMKGMAFVPLPKLTSDGCRVSILRVFDASLQDKIHPDDVIKATFMSGDLRLKIDSCRSDILIFDFKDFTMPIMSLIMANLKKFLILGTKGIPMRQKRNYVINAPPSAESLIVLAKSFIRKDLWRKLEVLRNSDELLKAIPKEILPRDYGGEELPLSELRDAWLDTLRHYRDWFFAENEIKADKSKKLTHTNSRLGDTPLEGSFRKINLD
ncbi:alpha-tocopherol transfer protein-like [Planococcus citri]|uniref:alpha-tocopherol transfer protein-like n=1 Tax=Planococcus citri TaxID=170843 RepID=UPI0031F828C0